MTFQTKRTIAAVGAVGVLLSLAACGGSSGPTATALPPVHTQSPSPSATPTGSSTLSAAGAEAFVREYYTALAHAGTTGDTSKVSRMASQACVVCWDDIRLIPKFTNAKTHAVGGDYRLISVGGHTPTGTLTTVDILYDIPEGRLIENTTGRTVDTFYAHPRKSAVLSLAYGGGAWHITAFTHIG